MNRDNQLCKFRKFFIYCRLESGHENYQEYICQSSGSVAMLGRPNAKKRWSNLAHYGGTVFDLNANLMRTLYAHRKGSPGIFVTKLHLGRL